LDKLVAADGPLAVGDPLPVGDLLVGFQALIDVKIGLWRNFLFLSEVSSLLVTQPLLGVVKFRPRNSQKSDFSALSDCAEVSSIVTVLFTKVWLRISASKLEKSDF
jgi:hypothetical protein